MAKLNRKAGLLIPGMIVCAVLARILGKFDVFPFFFGLLRSLIYISLYIGWGFSVKRRILQTQVRRYMLGISFLMVFWFTVRSIKYHFAIDPGVIRILWYWYYFPMLFIPLLSVFVALSLGKPEAWRLPKRAALLYLPTLLFLLLVVTNDFHQLVFSFPPGKVWSDLDYGYGPGCYFVMGWEILCALTAFLLMLVKCRRAQWKKYLPALLLSCSVVYGLIYISGAKWMQLIGGDITAVQCLLFSGILESCIQCGLIQTNTGYDELFRAGTFGAQIADDHCRVCYASANSPVLSEDDMRAAQEHAFPSNKHTLLKSHPIDGGRVYWQEDIESITALLEKLEENREALAEKNHLEQENYRIKREILAFREKNRLYDSLQEETSRQIDLLHALFSRYEQEKEPNKQRRLLAQMTVVGAYIKRRGNLIFISETAKTIDTAELSFCVEESMANLRLLGAACAADVPQGVKLYTRDGIAAYDFFEDVLEASLEDLRSVWLKLRLLAGSVLLCLEVECESSLSGFQKRCESCTLEDGVWRFVLPIGKAGEAS